MLGKLKTAARIAWSLRDGRHRAFWRMRRVKGAARRQLIAKQTAGKLPQAALASTPDVRGIVDDLERDGVCVNPVLLPPAWIADMHAYFLAQPCADPYRKLGTFMGPQNAPPGTHVGYFSDDVVARAPHALAIANHASLLGAVGAEMGAKPTISYMAAWWSVPANDGAQHPERYHRDADDIDFTKFFLYLTDVDETSGPHIYVKGSHKADKLTTIRRYSEREVHDAFGRENETVFTGPAGTNLLEKTYGFHRGLPPRREPRLMFQVMYSLQETVYGPKQPVAPMVPGVDPYINRVYLGAR